MKKQEILRFMPKNMFCTDIKRKIISIAFKIGLFYNLCGSFSKVELNFDYLLEHFSHKLNALLSKIPNLSVSAKICIFV